MGLIAAASCAMSRSTKIGKGWMMSGKPSLENRFERGLFASRWLMAPMYLGLVVALAMMSFAVAARFLCKFPDSAPAVEISIPEEKISCESIATNESSRFFRVSAGSRTHLEECLRILSLGEAAAV
mgnify:CR=1 FL=1